jgi:uncharacterized protein YdaU (DUF1376 family)
MAPARPAAQSSAQHQHTPCRRGRCRNRAAATPKIIFVRYYPSEMLVDTELLDRADELAYRRIFDRVLQTGDGLPDDDLYLARVVKASAGVWAKIKARLLELGMIIARAGRITIARCQALIAQAREGVAQRQRAGTASAAARARRSAIGKFRQPVEAELNFNGRSTSHESGVTNQIDPADAGSVPLSPPAGDFSRAAPPATPPHAIEQDEPASDGNASPKGAPPADLAAAFAAFGAVYPHIVNERLTRSALASALLKAPFREIRSGAENYRAWLDQPGNTTPPMNSAKWLREEGWRDRRYVRAPDRADPNVVRLIPTTCGTPNYAQRPRRPSPHQTLADAARHVGLAAQRAQHLSGGARGDLDFDFDPGFGVATAAG